MNTVQSLPPLPRFDPTASCISPTQPPSIDNRVVQAARRYVDRGFSPVPIPFKEKGPRLSDWQRLRLRHEEVGTYFSGKPYNVGLLLGEASHGLIDIDLDCPEVVDLATKFLPPTAMVFGRKSKRRSHWMYRTSSALETTKFQDIDGSVLVEIRSNGAQTVVPPSVHPSGECVEFDTDGDPVETDGDGLRAAVGKLASAALLARHWPSEGGRHDAALALAGGLVLGDWTLEDTTAFVRAVADAAGDGDIKDRERVVSDSFSKAAAGENVTGWPTLAGLVNPSVVERVRAWLRAAGTDVADNLPVLDPHPWPDPLSSESFHGLAGEIVRLIEPHTEADPAALLIQLLVAFGNVVGRGASFTADGADHHLNLFATLVGETAKGRKGTSWAHIRRLYETVAPTWAAERVKNGLSSGEGLIWECRDAITKREPIKFKGHVTGYEEVETDPGIQDKRLLVQEGEYANCLKVLQREGNTLSPVLREAWDSGNLRTMVKNNPAVASAAHISIIGHITRDELRRLLSQTETANGFANRFLWVCVRRSKALPDGGAIDTVNFADVQRRLAAAIEFSKSTHRIERDQAARVIWHDVYSELSEGKPGMFGAVTSRAEAQVMRLACIYALLDSSVAIRPEHLNAAIAIWRYCEASARYVFGASLGDRVAEEILSVVRATPAGLTRTQIRDHFGRHKDSAQTARALSLLLSQKLVRREQTPTAGRPTERWFYAGEAVTKAR